MDILRELSLLMEQDLGDLRDKPPEYRRRSDQLAALIQEITDEPKYSEAIEVLRR